MRLHAEQLERELAAKERELAQARGEALAILRWLDNNTTFYNVDADWPIDAPNVPVLAQVSERIWYHATDDSQSYPFSEVIKRALKPSPASGEQNSRSQLRRIAAMKGEPAPDFSKNTAPQGNKARTPSEAAVEPSASSTDRGLPNEPAAAVPDDPVVVYWRMMDLHKDKGAALHALAAHYLHRAPEGYALVPLEQTQFILDRLFQECDWCKGLESICRNVPECKVGQVRAILAAAKQEADQ